MYITGLCECVCQQQQVCIQSVTVVLDEDGNRQITLTREGEVIIGVNPAPALPYVDGRNYKSLEKKKFTTTSHKTDYTDSVKKVSRCIF